MTDKPQTTSWGWEPLIETAFWDDVDEWWRDHLRLAPDDKAPLLALLRRLEEIVPTVRVENGEEANVRLIRQSDSAGHWKHREHLRGAAIILELGELAAAAEGPPPIASVGWAEHREEVEACLGDLIVWPEVTAGVDELSRRAHVDAALELLESLDFTTSLVTEQMDTEEDRTWLSEIIAEVAFASFTAGRHVQAAWGKELEQFVPTGRKVRQAQTRGGDARRGQTKEQSQAVLKEIQRLVSEGHPAKRAAELAAQKGIGTSASANRQLHYRDQKRRRSGPGTA
ncbi:hypothetical protein [Mameliella sediminis]|uniref:hypothetical protein n=1 Tax=Mameliella sediminis TaxID=2836866 RepID=UPI001C46C091|nr:hypothetical protein [Mameliella sediminis]MBV7396846.1 hypothetical protein [Mameliella sediminis]MBY6116196.1 hypothetical protein [Antarctobacter heliothermus]MBY6146161.1 hypothetical protein [Mameliella alba]MCA0955346.1 hypothetical protein [Mameliella alba]